MQAATAAHPGDAAADAVPVFPDAAAAAAEVAEDEAQLEEAAAAAAAVPAFSLDADADAEAGKQFLSDENTSGFLPNSFAFS